jgi:hypothetical protein
MPRFPVVASRLIWFIIGFILIDNPTSTAMALQPNDIVSFYKAAIKHVILARDHSPTGQLIDIAQPTSYDGHLGRDFVGAPVTSLVVSIEYQDVKSSDTMTIRLYPDNGGPQDQIVVRSCEFPLYPASGARGCRLCFPVAGDRAISDSTSLAPGKYLIGIYVNEVSVLKASFRVKAAAQRSTACALGSQMFTSIQQPVPSTRQPSSTSPQTVAAVTTDSIACKNANMVVNYRTMLRDRTILSGKISQEYASTIKTLQWSEDYKGLIPYRDLLNEYDNFAYMALTMIRTSVATGDCVWARKGSQVSIIAVDQQSQIAQIRSGNQDGYYWIWSDSLR